MGEKGERNKRSLKERKNEDEWLVTFLKWNPLVWPFTLLFNYFSWFARTIHDGCKNLFDREVPWYLKTSLGMVFLFKLIYIIIPTDVIPDVVPYFGFLDDLALFKVFIMATYVFNKLSALLLAGKKKKTGNKNKGGDLLLEHSK